MDHRTSLAVFGLASVLAGVACSGAANDVKLDPAAVGGAGGAAGPSVTGGRDTAPTTGAGGTATTSETTAAGGTPTGGTATGGTATGGTATGGVVSNGGTTTGGRSTGGVIPATGGTSTGGRSTGGVTNGGTATGGVVPTTGGTTTGGTGGTTTGGTGGTTTGGRSTGGVTNGGTATGGVVTNGGTASGGVTNGGTASGGVTNGGTATGGVTNGGTATGGVVTNGGTATSTGGTSAAMPPSLPEATATCPTLATGDVSFLGSKVSLTVGPKGKKGPMVFYWHGTAMTSAEVSTGLGSAAINDVKTNGGVIASFTSTNGKGTNTGDLVWYTGDFDTADEILACAIQQELIDVTHIHSAGYSAGGLQTGAMVFAKGYLASVLCYSGGRPMMTGTTLPDKTNVPSMIGAHGPTGSDSFVGWDAASSTTGLEQILKGDGGFVIDCQDTGDHISFTIGGTRSSVAPAAWQFFKDHPYKNSKPYAGGLPTASNFPSYCKIY